MVYILINGSFGVGKTSVARELRAMLPGSIVFDPEAIGFVLKRLPGYRHSDYQHSKLWRRSSVLGAKLAGIGRRAVIIPMAFSQPGYLAEIRAALGSNGGRVLHFCLVAPLSVIRERLAKRGEPASDPRWSWVHRRAAECCAAHESAAFAVHIPTVGLSPAAIAAMLATEIRTRGAI
jgi:predicted kinase